MTKKDTVFIGYNWSGNVFGGPNKVAENLIKGLEKIGAEVIPPTSKVPARYNGCLQHPLSVFPNTDYMTLKYCGAGNPNLLMGPNLFVIPSEEQKLCSVFNHFLVPSQWVKDLYEQFSEMNGKTIDIWPVGIDTDLWKPVENKIKAPQPHGLIYHKHRAVQDLELIKRLIVKSGATYEVLSYGNYKEDELFNACNKVDFAVLLTGTESQGIALGEIMSSGIPLYIFNVDHWNYEGKYKNVPATSAPYFDETCGMFAPKSITIAHFQEFLHKLNTFKPREYILNNLSLVKQAQAYYDLLIKYQGR